MPSEIIAAFLWAQLENLENIQNTRKAHWNNYYNSLSEWAEKKNIKLPILPEYATNNAHMFYLVCDNLEQRSSIIQELKKKEILSVFHYISLHKSPFYEDKHDGRILPETDKFTDCLIRLPMYYELDSNLVIKNLIQ